MSKFGRVYIRSTSCDALSNTYQHINDFILELSEKEICPESIIEVAEKVGIYKYYNPEYKVFFFDPKRGNCQFSHDKYPRVEIEWHVDNENDENKIVELENRIAELEKVIVELKAKI